MKSLHHRNKEPKHTVSWSYLLRKLGLGCLSQSTLRAFTLWSLTLETRVGGKKAGHKDFSQRNSRETGWRTWVMTNFWDLPNHSCQWGAWLGDKVPNTHPLGAQILGLGPKSWEFGKYSTSRHWAHLRGQPCSKLSFLGEHVTSDYSPP